MIGVGFVKKMGVFLVILLVDVVDFKRVVKIMVKLWCIEVFMIVNIGVFDVIVMVRFCVL